jgi:AraC-like DNA-binding protein
MTSTVPLAQLDLTGLSAEDRLQAWQAANPAHEVTASDAMAHDTDPLGLTVWDLGPILIATSRLGSLRLSRRPELIRRDQIDHIAIAVSRDGSWRANGDDVGFDMTTGEISVVDLGQPIDTELTDASALQLIIPRDSLAGLDPAAAHGTLLQGATAGLFADYLHALERRLPTLQAEDLPAIARITLDLFTASLRPTVASMQRAGPAINLTLLQRFRRHVEQHLHDPNLTPETIAASLLISRARLYALLEPLGGVSAYIRTRRLTRAHARLRANGAPAQVKEIAYQVGFVSEAHFSRAFRNQYGCSPTEARVAAVAAPNQPADLTAAEIWLEWLRALR